MLDMPIDEIFDLKDDGKLCDEVFKRIAKLHGNRMDISKESKCERVVTLVWHSMGIIGNGGFYYLFQGNFNGDPGYIYTAAAFEKIGAVEAATAFKEALATFPKNKLPENIEERNQIWSKLPWDHDANRKFWRANDEIVTKLAAFIRANRKQFSHLP